MSTAPDSLSPALERVLEKFGGIVRRVCWRYHFMGAEVDELMQEVRIRLWHAHGGQERADEHIAAIPASYLHRTALSAAVDLLRRRRTRRADQMVSIDDEPEGMRETPGPDLALAESELAEQIERAVQSIQASRRPVVSRIPSGSSSMETIWSAHRVGAGAAGPRPRRGPCGEGRTRGWRRCARRRVPGRRGRATPGSAVSCISWSTSAPMKW